MTDRILLSLIKKLNTGKANHLIHLRPLTKTIDLAKVWLKHPDPNDNISTVNGTFICYFVKNAVGLYVSVVLDMSSDLHWYVVKQHRKKGYLSTALKSTILAHIFSSKDMDEQRITINKNQLSDVNYLASKNLALSLGFVSSDGTEFKLSREIYNSCNQNLGTNTSISKERLYVLQKKMNYLSRSIELIKTELEMSFGYTERVVDLECIANQVKDQIWRIEDEWWESNKFD